MALFFNSVTLPMMFEEILGNDSVKTQLQRASESLANTLLFAGPDGVGKTLFAKELAVYLMKTFRERVRKETHPDLHLFRPDGKTEMHSISSMRFLIEEVFKPPFEAKAKVFIICEAERMLPVSANALLKTLEEPTFDSYLFLLTSKPHQLLPTIISRAIRYNFSGLALEDIQQYLQEKYEKSVDVAQSIAALAQGSLGRACEIAEHPNLLEKRELLFEILHYGCDGDMHQRLLQLQNLCNEQSHREIDLLLEQIVLWYRDLHLLKHNGQKKQLFFPEKIQEADLSSIPSLENVQQAIEQVQKGLDRNMKLSTCLEYFFFVIQK